MVVVVCLIHACSLYIIYFLKEIAVEKIRAEEGITGIISITRVGYELLHNPDSFGWPISAFNGERRFYCPRLSRPTYRSSIYAFSSTARETITRSIGLFFSFRNISCKTSNRKMCNCNAWSKPKWDYAPVGNLCQPTLPCIYLVIDYRQIILLLNLASISMKGFQPSFPTVLFSFHEHVARVSTGNPHLTQFQLVR